MHFTEIYEQVKLLFNVLESEDEVEEEHEERQPSPEPVQENTASAYYENHPVT